ncbi:MAG TPA: cytochrome c biogenesis protein CcdA [Acidimicrobiia bacterium]
MITGAITSSNISVLVAFGGGIISILSPCVLPMIPGYLSLVTGLTVNELQGGEQRHLVRIASMTGFFALGFTAVFTLLGLAATALGQAAFENQHRLTQISGLIVFAMALYLAGSQLLRTPRLYPEARFQVSDRFGMLTAPLAGAAFAFGWSPCLGPVIAAVFGVAATQTGVRAFSLLIAYSLGMGVSFLLVGLAFGRWATPLEFVKRHLRTLTLASAALLAIFGLLLMFDRLWWLSAQLTNFLDSLGLNSIVELG